MAEETDDSQKTEAPSQRRLEEARAKGQLVVSREVATLLLFGTATLLAHDRGPGGAREPSPRVGARAPGRRRTACAVDGPGLTRLAMALLGELGWPLLLPLLALLAAPIAGGRPAERRGLDRRAAASPSSSASRRWPAPSGCSRPAPWSSSARACQARPGRGRAGLAPVARAAAAWSPPAGSRPGRCWPIWPTSSPAR